jgi:hypothetical protein
MYKIIVVLMVMLVVPNYGFAQESELEKKNVQLGLSFSTLGGSGIYYLAKPTPTDYFKITGIFIYDNGNDTKDSFFSLGAEYQRNLFINSANRTYAIFGASFDNSISGNTFFDESNTDRIFNFGVGMGIDFGSSVKGIVFNTHLTYQYTTEFGDSEFTRLGLGGGIGVGLNF